MSQNVYQMYEANGNKAGFFVRRRTWGNTYGRIISIGGLTEGPLSGESPYFKNQKVIVDLFRNDGSLVAAGEVLSCPGNYSYERTDAPPTSSPSQQSI